MSQINNTVTIQNIEIGAWIEYWIDRNTNGGGRLIGYMNGYALLQKIDDRVVAIEKYRIK